MKNYKKLEIERNLWGNGILVAGCDEVAVSPIMGDIVASVVIMDPNQTYINGVDDSKKLSQEKRLELEPKIKERSVAWSVAKVGVRYINYNGIKKAHVKVIKDAINKLKIRPNHVIIDYYNIPVNGISTEGIKYGDERSYSIACASILAKCEHERYMKKLSKVYPELGLEHNFGEYCPQHVVGINALGVTRYHRLDFLKFTLSGKIIKREGDSLHIKVCKKKNCSADNKCSYYKYSLKLLGKDMINKVYCSKYCSNAEDFTCLNTQNSV